MNILLATFWYLPHVGGVDTYLKVLTKGLEQRGHRVDVCAHHPDMNHLYLLNGRRKLAKKPVLFPLHELLMDHFDKCVPEADSWIRYREAERYTFELVSTQFGLDGYDLIHTHDILSTRAIARVKPQGMPHVATIHGLLLEEYLVTGEIVGEDSIRWRYSLNEERLGASSADITILPSEWLRREYMNRIGAPGERLTVIPYGLDTQAIIAELERIPREPRQSGKTLMICPARLVAYKGQRYLIEALGKLKRERDDFVCQFAGDGPAREELARLAEELGLKRHVQFLGNRSDIMRLYKQADLFVLPTLVENHSLAIMEAQFAGLPVIATRAGGNSELIVPDHTGVLVDPADADQLFEALRSLMNDGERRRRLAATGQAWARKYWHPRNMLERTLRVYEQAAGMKRGQ